MTEKPIFGYRCVGITDANNFVHCDGKAIMPDAYNNIFNGKHKYVSLQHEYIRQLTVY